MGGECGLFNMLGKQCQRSDSGKSQDYTDHNLPLTFDCNSAVLEGGQVMKDRVSFSEHKTNQQQTYEEG